MVRRTNWEAWGLGAALGAVLILAAVCGALFWLSVTFGPVRYNATNYDPELTRAARGALPVIAALNRYHSKHSAFPTHASQLAHYVPPGSVTTILIKARGWHYHPDRDGKGYALWAKIGWDTGFGYRYDGSKGHWTFSDEGPEGPSDKEIELKP